MVNLIKYLKTTKHYNLNTIKNRYLNTNVSDVLNKYKFSLHELCYRITHNIDFNKQFICPVCNKPIRFNGRGYSNTCSIACGRVISQNKSKKTNLTKYGVENVFQSKDIKSKIIESNLKKYGKSWYTQTEESKNRYKKYCQLHYGVDNAFQSKEIIKKIKDSNLIKYGKEYYTQTDIYKNQVKHTNLKKYGVQSHTQKHFRNLEYLNESYVRQNFIVDGYFNIREFADFFNMQIDIAHKHYKVLFHIVEPNKQYHLALQIEVYNYIKSIYNGKIILNDRTVISPKELDIYIPDKNLAIEFDGLMFHSYGKSDNAIFNNYIEEDALYHSQKTEACNKQKIQLLHIFENEWVEKKDIWKSVIKSKLGLITNKIYARKCFIKEVNTLNACNFLSKNHLQGNCASKVNLGLYYNNELVSLMTFSKSRFNKKYDYELIRFCNKLDTSVIGAASKLLKCFTQAHPNTSIISYANRRWSNGSLYNKLNFVSLGTTHPNYFYFKINTLCLLSRLKFQKHKLSDVLNKFDINLSETQNMYNNGYRKIYDCGNLIFELKK